MLKLLKCDFMYELEENKKESWHVNIYVKLSLYSDDTGAIILLSRYLKKIKWSITLSNFIFNNNCLLNWLKSFEINWVCSSNNELFPEAEIMRTLKCGKPRRRTKSEAQCKEDDDFIIFDIMTVNVMKCDVQTHKCPLLLLFTSSYMYAIYNSIY